MNPKEEERIQEKIEQIRKSRGDLGTIHLEQQAKRLAWWEANRGKLTLSGPLVRQAYEMILAAMSLKAEELPVAHEDERSITWRSFNFCPILEACQRLGLDTRVICKGAYEQSVQDLISQLSPGLRFSRNYEDLRPYGEYCEETIGLAD